MFKIFLEAKRGVRANRPLELPLPTGLHAVLFYILAYVVHHQKEVNQLGYSIITITILQLDVESLLLPAEVH